MTLQGFIDKLHGVGWEATSDAQHSRIVSLFRELFPKDAEIESLEEKIFNLEADEYDMGN